MTMLSRTRRLFTNTPWMGPYHYEDSITSWRLPCTKGVVEILHMAQGPYEVHIHPDVGNSREIGQFDTFKAAQHHARTAAQELEEPKMASTPTTRTARVLAALCLFLAPIHFLSHYSAIRTLPDTPLFALSALMPTVAVLVLASSLSSAPMPRTIALLLLSPLFVGTLVFLIVHNNPINALVPLMAVAVLVADVSPKTTG